MESEYLRTIWCGNLSDKVSEELLYELFLQAAPISRVKIPKDKEGRQNSYGFITFKHEESIPYSVELLNGISLFDRRLNLKARTPNNSNSSAGTKDTSTRYNNFTQEESSAMDPNKLSNFAEQMRLAAQVFNSYDNYSGSRHQQPGNRWERGNSFREEKRPDSYPYKFENRNSNSNHYNRRNAYDGGSNYHGNNRNRRRY